MTERVRLFDILKGICICMVVITHFQLPDSVRSSFYYYYLIEMAVPIFMMISGYLYAASMERKKVDSFEKAYTLESVVSQMVRYTIPYTIIFAIFTGYCFSMHYHMSVGSKFWEFVVGGIGPGGYYYPLLMQLVFVFPVVFFILKKKPEKGILIILVMNGIYEFVQKTYEMNDGFYRLMIFRYLLHIGFGAYVYFRKEKIKTGWLLGSFLIGIAYIYVVSYTGYQPKILHFWTSTSFVTAFYCFPIFYLLVRYLKGAKCFPLEIIGKSSYHIFLFQAVFYSAWYDELQKYIADKTILFFATFGICVLLGIIFWLLENPVNKWVVSVIKKPLGILDSKI